MNPIIRNNFFHSTILSAIDSASTSAGLFLGESYKFINYACDIDTDLPEIYQLFDRPSSPVATALVLSQDRGNDKAFYPATFSGIGGLVIHSDKSFDTPLEAAESANSLTKTHVENQAKQINREIAADEADTDSPAPV